jgi:thymidine kinase
MARGSVTFYTGCMFSGKSSSLIGRVREIGRHFECFKPTVDTRDVGFIVSRDKGVKPLAAKSIDDIREAAGSTADVIVFDEVQFFRPEDFEETISSLKEKGKIVLLGGLDRIANGKYWEIYPLALKVADKVINLTALCSICGEKATYTKKLVGSNADIEIEGEEAVFAPVCEKCFKSGQKFSENSSGIG